MPTLQNPNRSRTRATQAGYVMLEIAIGTAIMGIVMALALDMTKTGEDQTIGRTKAETLSTFSQLASQYLISNRTAIDLAMTDGTAASTHCLINVNADGTGGTTANSTTKHTCAFDTTLLKAKGIWPKEVNTEAPGGRYVAIARKIYDTQTIPVATGGIDILIALSSPTGTLAATTQDPRRTTELLSSMTTLGGTGGIIPIGLMGACTTKKSSSTYESCGNGWKINLADFVNPAQLTTFSDALPN